MTLCTPNTPISLICIYMCIYVLVLSSLRKLSLLLKAHSPSTCLPFIGLAVLFNFSPPAPAGMVPEMEQEGEKVYPAPLASHDDVVRCPALFMDSLRRFHSLLGTRFMIPVIGGKELDLQLLYIEVTKRGGLEKVVAERRWKEVIAAFNFPPTTTSASFVLRKYYISLLHHFEKVHFFRIQGSLVAPAVTAPARGFSGRVSPDKVKAGGGDAAASAALPIRKRRPDFGVGGDGMQLVAPINFPVVGTIDGKFDHGYLVTVRLGSETLRGVLFHPVPPVSPAPLAVGENAIVPYVSGPPRRLRRRRRRRRRDPGHPKPNRSAYNFFFAEKHSKLKALYPQREREFSKMIGESWNKLTQEERMVYQDCGLRDKERYKREMQEYRERLKLVQVQAMEEARAGPASQVDSKSETTTSDT